METQVNQRAIPSGYSTYGASPGLTTAQPFDGETDIIKSDDIIIAVMGITGAGKSTFIAQCTGVTSGIGHGLKSYTKDVSFGTLIHNGRKIRLIDTPGFDDSSNEHDDSYILKEIAAWLVIAYSQQPPLLLSGIVYLHPINEAGGRMKGSAKNNLTMFKAMCGDKPLSSVVLATTMWSKIGDSEGNRRQEDFSKNHWHSMIDAGSVVLRHDNTKESALRIIDHIISRKAQKSLQIQQQLVDEHMSVEETSAGQQLRSKVLNERARTEAKLEAAKVDLDEALATNDTEAAKELLDEQRKYEALLEAKEKELSSMKVKAEELFREKQENIAKAEARWQKQRQETEDKIENLKKDLETARQRQKELDDPINQSNNDSMALITRNEMLQMELKQKDRHMEIDRLQTVLQQKERQIELEKTKTAEATTLARKSSALQQELKQREQQLQIVRYQQKILLQQKQLRYAKQSATFGAIGAVAGLGALFCTVM